MRGKDHLFYLIKSLSKSEKRYFNLDAKKSGRKQSRYLALFKAINDQATYDEIPLKRQFGPKLGDDKARLYEAILRSMRDYQSKKSYKTRIKELLTDGKILFERKLYEQADNRLTEAKSLALELEDHLAVLEINLQQRQLMRRNPGKEYGEKVEALLREEKKHVSILENELWLQSIYDRLSVDIRQYPVELNEAQLASLNIKYADILTEKDISKSSFTALRRFHQIKALYNRLSGDREQMYRDFKAVLESWDGHEKNRQEDFFVFMGDASNVLIATFRDPDKIDEFSQLLNELEALSPPSVHGQRVLFNQTSIYRLLYLINTRSKDIDRPVAKIIEGLKQYDLNISAEMSIIFNLIILYLLNGRYEACQEWLDVLINSRKKYGTTRKDLQEGARILKLLTIYRTEDYNRIENTLRAGRRYFEQHKDSAFYDYYQLLHRSVNQLLAALPGEEKNILHYLKTEIEEKYTNVPNGLGELTLVWIDGG